MARYCRIAIAISIFLHLFSVDKSTAGSATFQFCWALGALDRTVYFAETESTDDRRSSFAELIEISGIDHGYVQCQRMELQSYRAFRDGIVSQWTKNGWEIVNTTFLSDLDY